MISRRLRYEVLRRDKFACRYCGATAPDAKLTVDHVVPVALGGSDEPSNLVTACSDCNGGKTSSSPDQPIVDDVAADALRWSRAMARAAETMLAARDHRKELHDQFLARWNDWTYKDWRTGKQMTFDLPGDWESSVDRILDAGLPIDMLCDCIDPAMGNKLAKDTFRYMCGIAWNRVRDLIDLAGTLTEPPEAVP